MIEKIHLSHLDREAYVYVRQSSMHQVRHNLESQKRQYDLKIRAEQLGFCKVVVLDEDLGISGSGSHERPGFAQLLRAVCGGTVGAVFALEASRLARNNRDWHHLIDLCVLTETLVIDHDGIYDPRMLNDRLLLGLKGTMSEFELGLLRQRAQEAFKQKVLRGEVLTEVPVGFIRTQENGVEITPDRQVREALHGVFSLFRKLGSARQVLLWYRQERIPLCAHHREKRGVEVSWRLPLYSRIIKILKNPIYAGAFVYGRTCTRTRIVNGRARTSSGHSVQPADWQVVIRDHHPGYITWEEYMQNQEQLASNLPKHHAGTKGPVKKGPALLSGLLRCGRCGRKLHVAYAGVGGQVPRYHCRGAHINHGSRLCISFGGLRVDQAVVTAVLDALEPAGIEASLEAIRQDVCERDEKRNALELSLEKARYEADRRHRQYEAVDPENRLVAADLEFRWNAALARVVEMEERLEAKVEPQESLSSDESSRLVELGQDLEKLWNHPDASVQLKKRILRTVLEEIVADVDEKRSTIVLQLHWAGGVHTGLTVSKNKTGRHGRSTNRTVVDLVRELVKVCPDASIANILNRLGYRTGADNTWTEARVRGLRSHHKIAVFGRVSERPWLTLEETAKELGVSPSAVRTMIRRGALPAEQVVRHAPWIIERGKLDLPEVRRSVEAIHAGRKPPRTDHRQYVMSFVSTT
ncbi:MAG: recombinase family protein [Candidatus Krumholzibacteria bacterium]|nr:recombinase family protein [Candidatus Krumholzibacteria bacterium]